MPDFIRRVLAFLRPRNPMPIEGREATRCWPKAAALVEVERAVVASNAAEVERVAQMHCNKARRDG